MVKDLDLKDIEKEIGKVMPIRKICFVSICFFSLGCFVLAYGFFDSFHILYVVIGAIWIVVGASILINGVMANRYKDIIENLIKQLRQSD